MMSDPAYTPLFLFTIVVLVILNGLVVLTNTALNNVSASKMNQMACEEEDRCAQRVEAVLEKPFRFKCANQLMKYLFLTISLYLVIALPYHDGLSLLVFLILTLAFSEYLPRKIAISHSEGVALRFAPLQRMISTVLMPLVFLVTLLTDLVLKICRQETKIEIKRYSEDQVMSILEAGQQSGEIKEEGKKMISGIFAFDDELAYEIMTPRTDVFLIDINDPEEEYLDELMEMRYSRIPVCEDETDNIIGILNIKDYLIQAREQGFDKVDIRSILRKPYFVPDTKNIDSLFFELQKEKQHIAILIDEYGGFSGIVTMEDIIEEVMGEIDDEYDQEEFPIRKIDDMTYIVDGKVSLDDLDEELHISLESENSETIGGLIIDLLGEIPGEEDTNRVVEHEHCRFTILSVRERRIEEVKIEILPKIDPQEGDAAE